MHDFFFPILTPYNKVLLPGHSGKNLPVLNRILFRLAEPGRVLPLDARHIPGTVPGQGQRYCRADQHIDRQFLGVCLFRLPHNRQHRLRPDVRNSSVHNIRADL